MQELVLEDQPRIIVATGSYIARVSTIRAPDTLFLAMPISRSAQRQHVGRLHRLHDGKKIVEVYDYVLDVDTHACADVRETNAGKRALGYSIHEQRGPP